MRRKLHSAINAPPEDWEKRINEGVRRESSRQEREAERRAESRKRIALLNRMVEGVPYLVTGIIPSYAMEMKSNFEKQEYIEFWDKAIEEKVRRLEEAMENMNDEEERDATNKLVAELNEKQKKIKEKMMVASSHSSLSSSSSFLSSNLIRLLNKLSDDIAKISQKINNTVVDEDEKQEKLELEIANKKRNRVNVGTALYVYDLEKDDNMHTRIRSVALEDALDVFYIERKRIVLLNRMVEGCHIW